MSSTGFNKNKIKNTNVFRSAKSIQIQPINPVLIKNIYKNPKYKLVLNPDFAYFWLTSGENPVCQLARSCHRPQTQAEKTAQQSPATGWLQKLDHHRHRSSRWAVGKRQPPRRGHQPGQYNCPIGPFQYPFYLNMSYYVLIIEQYMLNIQHYIAPT